jgi:PucR-like helix-turn-helix protein
MSDEPLPPELAEALRPSLAGLADQTIAAIGRELPDYARPLEGPFGRALNRGVHRALERFVDRIEDPEASDGGTRELYVALGAGEHRAGRSLDSLLGAYRIGARLAWERFVAAGEAAGHEPETLYRLAGAIFAYIDAISAESVEGWSAEQAAAESERRRRARALARLLARDDVTADEVTDLARLEGWRQAATVAALVVSEPDADRLASRLGGGAVAVADPGEPAIAFLPDPDAPGRRAQIEAAVRGAPAALGPTVALGRSSHSLTRARAAFALVAAGHVPGDTLAVADEHLGAMLLHGGDPALAHDLATRALAPLHALRPGARDRLRATLRAWLDHPGQVQRVASELHVHPQTVRYRMAQLRELFGERLDDAEARFELALALRATPQEATDTAPARPAGRAGGRGG